MKLLKELLEQDDRRHPPIPSAHQSERRANMSDPDTIDQIMQRMEGTHSAEALDVLQFTLSLLDEQQLQKVDDYVAEYIR